MHQITITSPYITCDALYISNREKLHVQALPRGKKDLSELVSLEGVKELYLQMLEIRRGDNKRPEEMLNLLIDLKIRNLKGSLN
jgi:hypothetical protein